MSFLCKKKPRRKKLLGLSRYSILGIALIFFLGFMGLGFAFWNDSITLNSTLNTGYIEPVFTAATLSSGEEEGAEDSGQAFAESIGEVEISEDGKTLSVEFDEADPNGLYYLDFTIKNNGSLPVELNDLRIKPGKYLEVDIQDQPKERLDKDEETEGQAMIQVDAPGIEEDYSDSFTVKLDYHQAHLQ
jgi:hypothetical protein